MTKRELLEELRELRRQLATLTKADIERTQLEEGRRIQREKYRALLDSMTARVWHFDTEGRVRRVNSTVVRHLGLPSEAIIGKTLYEVFPFDQAKKIETEIKEVVGSGRPELGVIDEYRLLSGAEGWAQYDKFPYYDKKGEIAGMITFAYDITERRRTEEALRRAEEKYRSIFEYALEGIFQSTPEGLFLSANPAYAQIYGFGSSEELMAEVTDIGNQLYVHPEDRREFVKLIEDKGFVEGFERQRVRKDGKSIWVSTNAHVVRNSAGAVLYYEGTIEDVTARKEAEEALLASRLKLSEAMDLARIVYWELDQGTGEFIFNDPYYAFYGTTAEGEGGYRMSREEHDKRFVHPDDIPLCQQALSRRFSSREPEFFNDFEHRIIRRDGEVRHIRARIRASRDAAGRTTRCYGANQDITDQKRAEEALAQKTAFLEALVHSSCDGIFVMDDQRQKIFQNRRYIELRKLPQGTVDEKDDKKQVKYLSVTVKNSEQYIEKIEYLYSHPHETSIDELEITDGTILERYSAPVVKDGRYYGRIWTFHDITERKRAENALATALAELESKNEKLEAAYLDLKESHKTILQQEKMASIGQLAAGVAHEINNPMGFIISNLNSLQKYMTRIPEFIKIQSEALGQNGASREEVADKRRSLKIDYVLDDSQNLIKESLEGADRVARIVRDLKNFSHVDGVEYAPADINKILESTLNIVWNELKHKATVKKEYGDIPFVRCNARQLSQVFLNILINAAQAITDFGEITIKTWQSAARLFVAISDTGSGVPENLLNKIFEPFFTTKEIGKGTGLGLSIAYDIVKKHKGEIEVLSEVGKGTTFVVAIPVEAQ